MIVGHFLLWARTAPPADRVVAVTALASAYLACELSAAQRREAETALTAMLDDSSAAVRRAMADVFAAATEAPRPVVLALANDAAEVAIPILARSPLLLDGDLVDCAALGDERVQIAIASRPWVSVAVSAALAEIGSPAALVTLARNPGSDIAEAGLFRIVERHGGDRDLREALLSRPDLPVEVAQSIAAALARTLESFVTEGPRLTVERSIRAIREARDRTTVALSARARPDVAKLVAHLRRTGQLTPSLLLRAVLSRETGFAVAALADLARTTEGRVAAMLSDRRGQGLRALYAKAGLPPMLRPAFEAALAASCEGLRIVAGGGPALSRALVTRALEACETLPEQETEQLVTLLRRFEIEAARDEAREVADMLADGAALEIVKRHAPEALGRADAAMAA